MDLILPLKREYFEDIKNGTKPEEYRLCTEYWKKRLEGRNYERIILTLGYPKSNDTSRRIIRSWKGEPAKKSITHKHFGSKSVLVYVIDVT